jgi:hypothetical protein
MCAYRKTATDFRLFGCPFQARRWEVTSGSPQPPRTVLSPQCMPSRSSHGRNVNTVDPSDVPNDPSDPIDVSSASRNWVACFKPLETTTKFSNNETRQDGDGYMNTSYEIRCYDYKTALPTNNDALGLLVGLIYSHDTLI